MTILTGDFAPDARIAALPAGAEATDCNSPESALAGPARDDALKLYLRHVEGGESIRALAREAGCHASTILRRIRRFETRRDDPLVDGAVERAAARDRGKDGDASTRAPGVAPGVKGMNQIARVLRRLAEPGAQLAVAAGMDKAIVVRDDIRTAILDRELAEHMAMRGWVQLVGQGRLSRYGISPQGREALRAILAARRGNALPRTEDFVLAQPVPDGCAEAATAFTHADQHRHWEDREITDPEDGRRRRARVNIAESPLLVLARRREADGRPFLAPELVAAGERLREDFELAQMGPRITQNWDRFLTAGVDVSRGAAGHGGGSDGARNRVGAALRELGPGMGDLCLRVCCFLEGIEMTERRLGWSARSGKIVLRLALMRLERHYRETYGAGAPLIG
ncbi:Helix-turn-helix domain-containing protein [Paracoccus thiocyanatus]|uniref:Helix-turn-helix domain-containing protein n=2 Tax=Paracoccus thiocyanatus TaxID=34006 RepID=A0A1N6Y6B5_9RHOB|nr:Helix-turn-helix domain-containing protein [Paracoccus thiocyanatus]